ncbi:MAG TPA: CAP domain-containing protein, partial [Pyrinomonadaceae bacterium]|nr:CAP domain-containing protein [Pyrinomonadaceae bacterium]
RKEFVSLTMSVSAHTNACQLFYTILKIRSAAGNWSVFLGIGTLNTSQIKSPALVFEAAALGENAMRWFLLSLLLVVSVAAIFSASRSSAGQDKAQSTLASAMLAAQNKVRQKFNVLPLIWNDDLAAAAQEWANKIAASGVLPPAHLTNSTIGQNMFWGTADQWLPKDVLEVWEAESKNYDRATNTCAPRKTCVHFTQVVWSTTTKVGCGKSKSADGQTDFFVCFYKPAGNYVGQSPFSSAKRE